MGNCCGKRVCVAVAFRIVVAVHPRVKAAVTALRVELSLSEPVSVDAIELHTHSHRFLIWSDEDRKFAQTMWTRCSGKHPGLATAVWRRKNATASCFVPFVPAPLRWRCGGNITINSLRSTAFDQQPSGHSVASARRGSEPPTRYRSGGQPTSRCHVRFTATSWQGHALRPSRANRPYLRNFVARCQLVLHHFVGIGQSLRFAFRVSYTTCSVETPVRVSAAQRMGRVLCTSTALAPCRAFTILSTHSLNSGQADRLRKAVYVQQGHRWRCSIPLTESHVYWFACGTSRGSGRPRGTSSASRVSDDRSRRTFHESEADDAHRGAGQLRCGRGGRRVCPTATNLWCCRTCIPGQAPLD